MSQSPYYKLDLSDVSNSVIARISRWFKKAKPSPDANAITTQLGVHFEEVNEMLDVLSPNNSAAAGALRIAKEAVGDLAKFLKETPEAVRINLADREEFLDALCDQIVTATGCGVLLRMDVTGAIEEVSNSNDSKFDPATGLPILHPETGKIMKGPAYSPPSLGRYV